MKFSYTVDGSEVLKDIEIDFDSSFPVVITGVENFSLAILGGILSGLFPIEREESFPQIEHLMKYFSGELRIENGEKIDEGAYIGVDPDRHILFSTVSEEIKAQLGFEVDVCEILDTFGLDCAFKGRKILTLSGGEKVKLALSILFNKEAKNIVMHGVVPWLDQKGRDLLLKRIVQVQKRGKKIFIIDQKIELFKNINAKFYYFNGLTLKPFNSEHVRGIKDELKRKSYEVKSRLSLSLDKNFDSFDSVVEFKDVFFDYNRKAGDKNLIDGVNLTLIESYIYGLTGENGSGKSTLAKMIMRIVKPDRGEIYLGGKNLKNIRRTDILKYVCYVGQFPERQLVYGDVEQYRERSKSLKNDISVELLNRYFDQDRDYPISYLDPLQLKFLLLFSSIGKNTRLVILDEPTWGIDIDGQIKIVEAIGQIFNLIKSVSVVLISHDREFLSSLVHKTVLLKDGKTYEMDSLD